MELVWVGIGGALGSIARYLAGRELTERLGGSFPYGTFTANVLGAFLIGILFVLLTERGIGDDRLRLLLMVGFLGGFTTFSTYTLDAFSLVERGQWVMALTYVVGSNLLGLLACLAGIASIRWLC